MQALKISESESDNHTEGRTNRISASSMTEDMSGERMERCKYVGQAEEAGSHGASVVSGVLLGNVSRHPIKLLGFVGSWKLSFGLEHSLIS